MGNSPFETARMHDLGLWQAGALWRRRFGILLTTAAFAGTAFGLASLAFPGEPSTRLVVMDRGIAARSSSEGSIGEAVSAAGGALAAGFKASAGLMSGLDPNGPALAKLSDVVRSAPAGSLLTEAGMTEFALAARDVLPLGTMGAETSSQVVADVSLPAPPTVSSPALLATALAGLAGLLASSFAAVSGEANARRRRRAGNRWDAPVEDRTSSRQDAPVPAPLSETSPGDAPAVAETPDRRSAADAIEAERMVAVDPIEPATTGDASGAARDGFDLAAAVAAVVGSHAPPVAISSSPSDEVAQTLPTVKILDLPQPRPAHQAIEADDIAEAVLAVGIPTVLVVEAGAGPRSCGSVDLLRALAARDATCILVDLGFDRIIADDLGIETTALGLSDFLTGTVDVAPIIHRDAASRADAIVWGRDIESTPIRGERLEDLFATLGTVYDCILVAGGATSPGHLTALLGEDGAIVVSTRFGEANAAEDGMAEIAEKGASQVLSMSAYPRIMVPRMAEAA